jgi:hypothetical protein
MICAPLYVGDDMELAAEQHDGYRVSFRVMLEQLADKHVAACQILDIPMDKDRWPRSWSVDHRTLQACHDRLAGAWRYHVSPPEPPLPMTELGPRTMAAWLDWLKLEVQNWGGEMTKLAITIIENQNQEAGYDAETRLEFEICARFHFVPWTRWPPLPPPRI